MVSRERSRGFPESDFADRESLGLGVVEDQLGQHLGRRVAVNGHNRFLIRLQLFENRVGLVHQHFVVPGVVEPFLEALLDLDEIHHHAPFIQRGGGQFDLHLGVVPVKQTAFAVVVEEPVAVGEMDFFRDFIHRTDLIIR